MRCCISYTQFNDGYELFLANSLLSFFPYEYTHNFVKNLFFLGLFLRFPPG